MKLKEHDNLTNDSEQAPDQGKHARARKGNHEQRHSLLQPQISRSGTLTALNKTLLSRERTYP